MENRKFLPRAHKLIHEIENSGSMEEGVEFLLNFLSYSENIPEDTLYEIKQEIIDDIKSGYEADAHDEIRDELRDEVEEEIKGEYEKSNAWVYVRDKAIENTIKTTIESLSLLIEIIRTDNKISSDNGAITPIQKEQLLAVLKAAIAELEAPYISKGKIRNLRDWLFGIAKKAAEKKMSGEITDSFDKAQRHLGEVLDKAQDLDVRSPF